MRLKKLLPKLLSLFGLSLLLSACGNGAPDDAAMRPYANETMVVGAGLGDLKLGQTTIADFLTDVGRGRVAYIVGDESGFEFTFNDGQASFLFNIDGDCKVATWRKSLREYIAKPEKLFMDYPSCRDLTLSSISIAAGDRPSHSFWKGKLDSGVGLFEPAFDAMGYGEMDDIQRTILAGQSAHMPKLRYLFKRGLVIHAVEVDTGNDLKVPQIRRLTLFVPVKD